MNTREDVETALADYFHGRPEVDRVLYEYPTGSTTIAFAGLNRHTDMVWRLIGIDPKELGPLLHEGVVNGDGSVPNPARFLARFHNSLPGGDLRLALLTLTAADRTPLQWAVMQHIENAVPPDFTGALPRPQAPET